MHCVNCGELRMNNVFSLFCSPQCAESAYELKERGVREALERIAQLTADLDAARDLAADHEEARIALLDDMLGVREELDAARAELDVYKAADYVALTEGAERGELEAQLRSEKEAHDVTLQVMHNAIQERDAARRRIHELEIEVDGTRAKRAQARLLQWDTLVAERDAARREIGRLRELSELVVFQRVPKVQRKAIGDLLHYLVSSQVDSSKTPRIPHGDAGHRCDLWPENPACQPASDAGA